VILCPEIGVGVVVTGVLGKTMLQKTFYVKNMVA
jgi:hypothetical protein